MTMSSASTDFGTLSATRGPSSPREEGGQYFWCDTCGGVNSYSDSKAAWAMAGYLGCEKCVMPLETIGTALQLSNL